MAVQVLYMVGFHESYVHIPGFDLKLVDQTGMMFDNICYIIFNGGK